MKILADANPLFSGPLTGIGYFTHELIAALDDAPDTHVDTYAFNFFGKKKIDHQFAMKEQRILPGKLLSASRRLGLDLPLDLFFNTSSADIILGTNFLVPPNLRHKPIVATIHDLSFIDHPTWVQTNNAKVLTRMVPKTLARSSGLLAISNFTASRIRELYDYKKPILVIDIPPKKSYAGQLKPNGFAPSPQSYFLFVSTIEPRKNLKTLLDAYEMLSLDTQDRLALVICGKPGWDEESLARIREAKNNIIYLNYVKESERNWLYANALCTVVPSHYEGFGMMTLESLDLGTPVITSNIPPQIEILGEAGDYFEANDSIALRNLLERYSDTNYRSKQFKKQVVVLKNYSWKKTANKIADFLKEFV